MPSAATLDPTQTPAEDQPTGQRKRAAKAAPAPAGAGDVLSKSEAAQLRPWLVDAMEQTSGDLDNLLTHTNANGAISDIWQLDRMEAEALADILLRRAQASVAAAMVLRQSMSYWAYYQAGVILFPRFWSTWGFYAGNGLDVPLPGVVREQRKRGKGATVQAPMAQPAPMAPTRPASGGPVVELPATTGVVPQARAAAVAVPAAVPAAVPTLTPTPAAKPAPAASTAAPVDQAAAEAAYMRHRAAVNASTDAASAYATRAGQLVPGADTPGQDQPAPETAAAESGGEGVQP